MGSSSASRTKRPGWRARRRNSADVAAACAALDAKAGREGTRGMLERLAADLSARHGATEAAGVGAP